MATNADQMDASSSGSLIESLRQLLWGADIKHDVFRRWTQGVVFSEHEATALIQHEGGPCAVIAPLQAFILKHLFFNGNRQIPQHWRNISEEDRDDLLVAALEDMFALIKTSDSFTLVYFQTEDTQDNCVAAEGSSNQQTGSSPQTGSNCVNQQTNSVNQSSEEEEGISHSPKKQCFSHEQFHSGLRCKRCHTNGELHNHLQSMLPLLSDQYGVLLVLYSLILTRGLDQLKNEVEDPTEALIDGTYGHGSQSLINLLLTGRAVSNVWDNDKDISGLTLHGISRQATVGFLTILEHLRLCEVGWYLKNPEYPIWLLGSETHLTVLFSQEQNLVAAESPDQAARRIFTSFDTEGSGFVSAELLGDLLGALDLVSEPEYVTIMREKLDPEQLGIVTLNSFLEEFFPRDPQKDTVLSFQLYHYNGLRRSCPNDRVAYVEGQASIMEVEELQIISDCSPIKTCIMTKWPTVELKWKNDTVPSLN